jgi:putative transposase
MPWKINSTVGERWRLVKALLRNEKSVSRWCRHFGVSRKTAYKWRERFTESGRCGLRDRKRRPHRMPRRLRAVEIARIRRARKKHAYWGPKKIRVWFRRQGWRAPALRTVGRWLGRLKLTRKPRRRSRKGGVRLHPALTLGQRPNQVWTVDFKGWFCTRNGQRCEPLTVRDLFSRYGLAARLLPDQRWTRACAVFTRLFRERGLPEIIRVDNGGPFASTGPAGLSRLSVWWRRLGIAVEFTRPGHPEDNGAHEQFHRVLKRETLRPVARTRQGQQHRITVWLRRYNEERPHEALGQQTPRRWYRVSRRKYPRRLAELTYAAGWAVRRVRSNGEIKWRGRQRFIGEAFVGQRIGLESKRRDVQSVYFGKTLIGRLHAGDAGGMRPMKYWHRRRTVKNRKV